MTDYKTAEGQSSVTDGCPDLEKRDVRALTEYMTTLPLGGHLYSVTTESGSEYHVDALEERCTCPDYEQNLPTDDGRERCKHLARVAFATGERSIPEYANVDAIDSQLGEHTENSACGEQPPTLSRSNNDSDQSGRGTLRTDGGAMSVPEDTDVCQNGNECCDGPDGESFPCFDCYEVDQ
ncbi:hypothetical protein [Natronomonas amylolytica]|uniref:hypothetical protein n=1 Tax=Natronomonas amylolytica TaxID=3108498 RepID=UPI003009C8C3